MIRTVTLVRHGESELNVRQPSIVGGRSRWCELTPRGIAQARHLGRWLADSRMPIDRVVSSTAVRAQQTARYALEQTPVPLRSLETFVELEEMGQGQWENLPRAETYTPAVIAQIRESPWTFSAPGGESQGDVCRRAQRWLDAHVLTSDVAHTWVFTHGMVIKLLVTGLRGGDQGAAWQIPIQNTSLTRIQHDPLEGWVVRSLNTFPQGTIDDAVYL